MRQFSERTRGLFASRRTCLTITVEASIPDDVLREFLQHLRNFDTAHDPERTGHIHLEIGVEAPGITASTMQQIFDSIRPPFENKFVMQGKADA